MKKALLQKIKWRSLFKLIVLGLVAVLCVVPLLYFVVLRDIDAAVCYSSLGQRLGVPADYYGIATYVYQSMKPGMSRDAAHARLSEVGKVIVEYVTPSNPYTLVSEEVVNLRMCLHPMNDIRISIAYDENWILLSARVLDE